MYVSEGFLSEKQATSRASVADDSPRVPWWTMYSLGSDSKRCSLNFDPGWRIVQQPLGKRQNCSKNQPSRGLRETSGHEGCLFKQYLEASAANTGTRWIFDVIQKGWRDVLQGVSTRGLFQSCVAEDALPSSMLRDTIFELQRWDYMHQASFIIFGKFTLWTVIWQNLVLKKEKKKKNSRAFRRF